MRPKRGTARAILPLGIWPNVAPDGLSFQSYVRFTWRGGALTKQGVGAGVRPGFADGGNSWFRVNASGTSARNNRRYGWGTTFDIGARHNDRDDDGAPERVMAPFPVNPESLENAEVIRPTKVPDFQRYARKLFDERLFAGRTRKLVVGEVIKVIGTTTP